MHDRKRRRLPAHLTSPAGLSVELNANGSLRRLLADGLMLNLFPGNELEGGPANLYLRRRGAAGVKATTPLLGPRSPSAFAVDTTGFGARGIWQGVRFELRLVLAETTPAWFWHLELANDSGAPMTLDLLYAQDLGLGEYGFLRTNEYYASHYLDHTPLAHPVRGLVLATRQNLAMNGHHPWTLLGALGRGVAFCTDALQFHGLATRAGLPPAGLATDLPGRRQHEHSLAAIQDEPVTLAPGARLARGFFGCFVVDHPAATTAADLSMVDGVLALAEARGTWPAMSPAARRPARTLFGSVPLFSAAEPPADVVAAWLAAPPQHVEQVGEHLLSAFGADSRHLVMKRKELGVLRPHGQILRSGGTLCPDEGALTTTVWMNGVFNSMLTQGHVAINRLLSAQRGYLGLFRSHGQRVFVETTAGWQLLDVPSAFVMKLDRCEWLYQGGETTLRVDTAVASGGRHAITLRLEVLNGAARRFLICHHIALGGDDGSDAAPANIRHAGGEIFIAVAPNSDLASRYPHGGFAVAPLGGTVFDRVGGDELLFRDGRSRRLPYLCLVTAPAETAGVEIRGELVACAPATAPDADGARFWRGVGGGLRIAAPARIASMATAAEAGAVVALRRLGTILPWFAHNALVHYLAPRGLEQFTGGGWGTRDVCQGPLELLLAFGQLAPARDLLRRVFSAQNGDGDWPQWFTFFESERHRRAADSHGDIVFWPLLALGRYLETAEDGSLLDAALPFFHPVDAGMAEHAPLWRHVERALAVIDARTIPGTGLVAYGRGDWNDAMQPVDPALRERLCSAWTVTLHYQALRQLAAGLRACGREPAAARCIARAARLRTAFQRWLVVDGVTAGFAHLHRDGRIEYLLHPRDATTGIRYSLLPMVHAAMSDLYTPAQAAAHLALVETHLLGPDGARLFNRPMPYRGGPERLFRRAESAAFFGREVGLMYTHAHLRYAEALAHHGRASELLAALARANPIGLDTLVPSATRRQANCYYSSSDAAFDDRYQAAAEYTRALAGETPLDGGWRVYSSGPGIAVALVVRALLGLRLTSSALIVDPVIPADLSGLEAKIELGDHDYRVTYRVASRGCGPRAVSLNGHRVACARLANPYRPGGVKIARTALLEHVVAGENRLFVEID